ncbi:MAG: NUDIX domain-containing protein [bacterium]|nr:NUDIX domain-containing protein [bacterium]
MANEKLFWVGIKALIENKESKVLLLHSPGWKQKNIEAHWDIPGGRIEQGQSAKEALKREVQEETGVTNIENSEFFNAVISNHEIDLEGRAIGLVLMIYKVKISEDSQIKLSDEHTSYEWVDKKEAAKRLAHKYPPEFTTLLDK